MNLAVKVPYSVVAKAAGEVSSIDEAGVVSIVDEMAKNLRLQELVTPTLDTKLRNELLQKHVERAYEYYKSFSSEDMAKMLIVDEMLSAAVKEVSDDDEK